MSADTINRLERVAKNCTKDAICFLALSLRAAKINDCLLADYYKIEAGRAGAKAVIYATGMKIFSPQAAPRLN